MKKLIKPPQVASFSALPFWNKRLVSQFVILKTWEAGVVLPGIMVKMILQGNFDISKSYIFFSKKNELFLTNVHFKKNLKSDFCLSKKFKLLLNKNELISLQNKKKQGNFTVIPTKIYWQNSKIKLEIALAKGLKKYEKKQKLINQDLKRKHKDLGKILKI